MVLVLFSQSNGSTSRGTTMNSRKKKNVRLVGRVVWRGVAFEEGMLGEIQVHVRVFGSEKV